MYVEEYLFSHWDEFGFSSKPPDRFRYLLFRRMARRPKKIIIFCIPEHQIEPLFLVKILQDNDEGGTFRNEYEVLRKIRDIIVDKQILESVPRAWCLEEMGGHLALVESFVQGEKFLRRRRKAELFQRSVNWLIQFHQATASWKVLTSEDIKSYFIDPLVMFVNDTKPKGEVGAFLAQVRKDIVSWSGRDIPLVLNHNDFIFSNILFRPSGLSVVDWEFANYPSLPFGDFIHHCFRYVRLDKWLKEGRIVNFSNLPRKYRMVGEAFPCYLQALRLSEKDILALTVYYFIGRHFLFRSIGLVKEAERNYERLIALARERIVFL